MAKVKLTIRIDTGPVGRRMTARMQELNLDDEEVAEATGLSKDTIRAYRRLPEDKVHPTAENAAAVAKVLKWTTDQLLHGTDLDVTDAVTDELLADEMETLEDEIERLKSNVAAKLKVTPTRVTVTLTII